MIPIKTITRITLRKSIYIIFLFVISCSGKKKAESATVAVMPEAPKANYAVYLPAGYDSTQRLPVLILLDPHADGSLPISKYKLLADQFHVILMGSNESKNGASFEQTNQIVSDLVAEAKKMKADTSAISVCGFSGGAKVALIAGMNIKGLHTIIYCGAGLPPQQLMQTDVALPPALGFAGVRDLNYTELVQTDEALQQKNSAHCLVEWNGKHEWVDSISFADAFYWMEFRSKKKDRVQEFMEKNSTVQKNPLAEWRRLKKMIAFLDGVADVSKYIAAHEALIKSKEFQAAIQKTKKDFEEETMRKQEIVRFIDEKDLKWWKSETDKMKAVKGEKEIMNQRLLSYISLACFGLTNAAIKQGDKEAAEKILVIYKMVDPDNPDRINLENALHQSAQ